MPISFNSIPSSLRTPATVVEIDNSLAARGPALLPYRALLIGQKTSSGTADADSLHLVTSAAQVGVLAGRGSMLHRQAMAWFASNKATEVWIGVLADDSGGTAATGILAFTGPATENGTLPLYLGGVKVPVSVADEDTAIEVAASVAAAVNANGDLPVTATQGTTPNDHKVTITFRHKGAVGNEYDIRFGYHGEAMPAGIDQTITAMASGAGNPDLTDLFAAMGDSWFHVWAHPYTDSDSLDAIETELADRFGPSRMIDAVAFSAKSTTHGALVTLGNSRNSPHSSIVGTNDSPTPPMEYAAAVAGVAAFYGNLDPARPFQTLPLNWVKAPDEFDQYTLEERDVLLKNGVATTRAMLDGTVVIERLVTTYQTNAAESPDESYLDVTTMLTLMYFRYSFRALVLSKYPRHKLGNDGTRFGQGQAVVTPSIMKAEAVLWFRQMEELGLVENFDQFKADLIVERNESDPNRLDIRLPPDLVNQLMVSAIQIQFRL